MNETNLFTYIRKYSKYCSVCGNKLNLEKNHIKDWHLPFCLKCRQKVTHQEIIESERRRNIHFINTIPKSKEATRR